MIRLLLQDTVKLHSCNRCFLGFWVPKVFLCQLSFHIITLWFSYCNLPFLINHFSFYNNCIFHCTSFLFSRTQIWVLYCFFLFFLKKNCYSSALYYSASCEWFFTHSLLLVGWLSLCFTLPLSGYLYNSRLDPFLKIISKVTACLFDYIPNCSLDKFES